MTASRILPSDPDRDPVEVYLATALRRFRKQMDLSQEALAAELGISFQQLGKYENGKAALSASMVFRAARALGVPVEAFFPVPDRIA